MIVVAGGTGALGSRLVRCLAERGLAVRILTRDPIRAQQLVGGGVEAVCGDVRDAASLKEALVGASTVVSAIHGFVGVGGVSPASVDRGGNFHLMEAASRVGAAFILMSVVGAAAGHPRGAVPARAARAIGGLSCVRMNWPVVSSVDDAHGSERRAREGRRRARRSRAGWPSSTKPAGPHSSVQRYRTRGPVSGRPGQSARRHRR